MRKPLTPARITCAAVLVSLCAVSFAQDTVGWKLHCLSIGNSGQLRGVSTDPKRQCESPKEFVLFRAFK